MLKQYDYDPNGNRITKANYDTLTYGNSNNRLTEHKDGTTTTYTFDRAGRVKQIDSDALSYDAFDNMTAYASNTYTYDAYGQRLRKTENGVTKYYVTSGPSVLGEYDSSGSLQAEYIYGLRGMVAQLDPSKGYLWLFTDHLGSTRQVGNSTMQRDYYPYGEVEVAAGNDDVPYQFTGKELDTGVGLHYFGARYYDARIGRWLVSDPARQFFSPYVYGANNPLSFVDPDGEFVWFVVAAAVIGGGLNVYQNWDNIGSFWQGLQYFGVGAASGALSTTGPAGWFAGGFITGAGNTALGGGGVGNILQMGFVGGFSGLAGGVAGQWASKAGISVALNGLDIYSPVLTGALGGAVGGLAGGFAGGFTANLLLGGNFSTAWNAGKQGAMSGLGTGVAVGTISAGVHAYKQGLNPITGKPRVGGLTIADRQRVVGSLDERSGLKTLDEINRPLSKGGTRYPNGIKSMKFGKRIYFEKIGSNLYKAIVLEIHSGQVVNTWITTGTAQQLGIFNIQHYINTGHKRHFIGK